MADEHTRETYMIRIRNPKDSNQFVDVKILTSISFTDPAEGNQQYVFRFNNHPNGDNQNTRITRKQTVTGSDHVSTVDVERITAWGVTIPQDNNQEMGFRMTNNAQEPPVHFKTHKFKISNPHQPGIWVEMQRIDEIQFIDPKDRQSNNDGTAPASNSDNNDITGGWPNQEKHFRLTWPDDDMSNPSHVNTDDDGTSINPPYRFDPFQDLVDVHWGHHPHGAPEGPTPGEYFMAFACTTGTAISYYSAFDLSIPGNGYVTGPTGPGNYGACYHFAGKQPTSPGDVICTQLAQPACPCSDPSFGTFTAPCDCNTQPECQTTPDVVFEIGFGPPVACTYQVCVSLCILTCGAESGRSQFGMPPCPSGMSWEPSTGTGLPFPWTSPPSVA